MGQEQSTDSKKSPDTRTSENKDAEENLRFRAWKLKELEEQQEHQDADQKRREQMLKLREVELARKEEALKRKHCSNSEEQLKALKRRVDDVEHAMDEIYSPCR